jgi:septal ring factor EnvC (AmiA/AmiB activator)
MSKIEDVVGSLENKIDKVLHKLQVSKQTSDKLSEELQKSQNRILQLEEQISEKEENFETLKIASAMLGSDDNKRETKLKINTLIRDIDHCIAQLSE